MPTPGFEGKGAMVAIDTRLIHDYTCHEGNYRMANILNAARLGR